MPEIFNNLTIDDKKKEKELEVQEMSDIRSSMDTEPETGIKELSNESKRKIKIKLWKNCFLLSFSWLCLYSGYNSISSVQSSLNNKIGVFSLSVEFAGMALGNLFFDSAIIKRLGCKWSIALGMGVYVIYMAGNFYPQFYTLLPLAAVSGVCSAAMWVAQSTYLARIAQCYSEKLHTSQDNTKSKFLGILYMFYLGSNIIGQIVSSLILGSDRLGGPLVDVNFDNPYASICGANYCNEDLGTGFKPDQSDVFFANSSLLNSTLLSNSRAPSRSQVYAFCGFCVSAGVVATLLVVFFLDTLPSLGIDEDVSTGQLTTKQLLTAAVRQWSDVNQLLLIPIGIYNGMDNPFWSNEFTKAFVTCAIGMYFIGYVMVCYGLSAPISSFIFGWLGKRRLIMIPFVVAYLAHFCTAISLLYWKPSTKNVIEMFILTGAWGIGSGVWSAQVPTIYSQIFVDNLEAAFSNSRLWDAVGRTMSYGWSYPLCLKIKIYLMVSMVTAGMIGLIGIEIKQCCRKRQWKVRHAKEKPFNSN